MNISDELKQRAIANGLCKQWTGEWKDSETLDTLCEKYVKGIDFCIEHDYPNIEYMKKNFDGVMQKHGIYCDEAFISNNALKLIVNGICTGEANYDRFGTGRIYVRHSSFLKLNVRDLAKVFVSTYDKCEVEIDCEESAKVYVYKHGGNIKYDVNNKNIIIHEQL